MKKNYMPVVLISLVIYLLISCSRSDIESNPTPIVENFNTLTSDEVVALNAATKNTLNITSKEAKCNLERFFYLSNKHKSNELNIVNIKTKTNKQRKDLYFEIEFASDGKNGFAIMSSDERIPNVLCYVSKGSLADTNENEILKFLIRSIDKFVENSLNNYINIDSLLEAAKRKILLRNKIITKSLPPFDPATWTFQNSYYDDHSTDKIKDVEVAWHQHPPFNNNLQLIPGIATQNGRAYAGCGTVATAHIMSYHKKPYKNITQNNWNSMVQSIYDSNIPVLFENLYNDLGTTSTIAYSSSTMQSAKTVLENNSYTVGNIYNAFNFDKIWSALNYGPTMIRGDDVNSGDGHRWVVDGARCFYHDYYEVYSYDYNGITFYHTDLVYSIISKYLKYNWGWTDGNSDNWFISSCFEPGYGLDLSNNISLIEYIY